MRIKGKFKSHGSTITCLAWDPTSRVCASGGIDTHVFLWNPLKKFKKFQIKFAHKDAVTAVTWKDENTVMSTGLDGILRVHEVKGNLPGL